MRMRLKKHLEERLDNCKNMLAAREPADFYKLTEQQKNFVRTPRQIFGNDNPVWLELGCGKGGWAIKTALLHPEVNIIALEKLSNVIVVGCEQAQRLDLPNLRFFNCRAENLLCYLPPASADRIVLNFSCPFPKKTYANRRLTSPNYLRIYKQLLTSAGEIRQKTDDVDFFEYSIASLREGGFVVYDATNDLPPNDDDVVTEYEAKFRAEHKPIAALKARPVD